MNASSSIGATIRATREALDLSVEEFAERAGIEARLLRDIERGRHQSSPIMADHLARVAAAAVAR